MNDPLAAAKQKAETTYNAAADSFDAEPLAFWSLSGRRTIERLALRRGAQVLDVCCGSGASALPAAEAVGPEGSVLALDLAEGLLALGRAKAAAAGLRNVEFRRGDMTATGFPDGRFDAVVCVFGIFFVPDMEAQVAELWRLVKPGGQLAITTWGTGFFEPGTAIWLDAVRRVRPDLATAFHPWDRITTPGALRQLFADARVPGAEITAGTGHQLLRSPEDFWTIALGSGMRWTIDRLEREEAMRVRQEVLEELDARRVDRIETNVLFAVARRAAVSS